MEIKRMTPEML